ncbi:MULTISPECIES: IS110 family RNA-guided transposase [Arcobacteraceae]|jgi:transposase|uniref:Transposase IS116/IS110/IS902 family protein n=9 Tax=Arcobacteraceae TaxID=2808963 RepID=A0A1C0ATL7_9BACT|nr:MULTISPECIES: IS110 family transposase [Arcobacteraceae]NCB13059.1 IS110 family transposase [Erysipelotrichia bacterium]MCT7433839.1 IS110 family transposase [Aliarcobacter cryaerophilus]MCT7464952.1 IS110 family transposase [Aliarcobacter cryaerophilus]MCT7482748.1 IS110 family transposase [Aliarcobacter cryaerophilus]MCT7512885.1 IS110 family transposase [Aliarcobacter cryaerophilus]
MYYVGIDIAKSFHVVTIIDENEVKVTQKPIRVTNCIDGFSKFITKLETISSNTNDFIIGLEATGIYGENLWEFLNSHGFNVKLLNPFQTTRYREQHTMKKVKNDNIDSWIIALFLKDGKYSSGYVTDDEYQSLRTLYRNRASIQSDMKEVKKRILTQVTVTFPELENFIDIFSITGLALLDKYPTAHHYKHSSVDRILKIFRHIQGNSFNNQKAIEVLELAKNSIYSGKAKDARAIAIKSSIRLLKIYQEELSILEEEILALLEKNGIKEEKDVPTNSLIENLKTIPGVSSKTIAAVISECGDLSRFKTPIKFIGYLGLFPTENSSGNSKSTGHLSKRGSSLAKHALYMASVSCLLHNKELKQYYDTKKSQGKSKQEGIIAVARKLATIIYSIFRYNTPYDPSRVFSKS